MSVTTDQLLTRSDRDRGGYPVAASTLLYSGTLMFVNSGGYADDDTANGLNVFGGVVCDRVDNSAGANGDLSVEVWQDGKFVLTGSGFTQASVGQQVYASDNYTISTSRAAAGVYIGTVREYIDSTHVVVEIESAVSRTGVLTQTFAVAAFTDDGSTSGHVDFTAQLPAGACVKGWKAVVTGIFGGDTSAIMQVGVAGTLGRFSSVTTGSVFTAGTIGANTSGSANAFCAAATTPRITVTGGADFTSIVSNGLGVMTVSIFYDKY